MQVFKKNILNLATEFSMEPQEIASFEMAFDFIVRFAHIKSIEELNLTIIEHREGKKYRYEEIPAEIKRVCKLALSKYGSIGRFYNDYDKAKNLKAFVKNMIEQRKQPRDFWSSGILTYRHLKRGDFTDKTCEITEYAA